MHTAKLLIMAAIILMLNSQNAAYGQDATQKNYAYFSIEPQIVTNFLSPSVRKVGFVTVSIELMLEDAKYLEEAEHHSPLLRSALIEVFGQQTEEKVRSLTGREDIRRHCLDQLRKLMRRETGSDMVKDVIFTKYLYH